MELEKIFQEDEFYCVHMKLTLDNGLHMRPASDFVKEAGHYKSQIYVGKIVNDLVDGNYANAKSIMSVISLCFVKNDIMKIRAKGKDAENAISGLIQIVNKINMDNI